MEWLVIPRVAGLQTQRLDLAGSVARVEPGLSWDMGCGKKHGARKRGWTREPPRAFIRFVPTP